MKVTSHAVHLVARAFLRAFGLEKGLQYTRWLVRQKLDTRVARHVAAQLEPFGTCLTRSVALAAWLPDSTIVLGGDLEAGVWRAHAWVEVGGRPLRSWDPRGKVLVRCGPKAVTAGM
jgi:hypothetical protein